jgi:predicted nuclease of restriction endonuclease-like (RecB) superfamily
VRQLDRQIATAFHERTMLPRACGTAPGRPAPPASGGRPRAEEELKHPMVLEFLALRDEHSESDLEDALLRHLEESLLKLGGDFAFVGRQRRLRIGAEWYRVDLLFFHRRLHCLVVIALKIGRLMLADTRQMNVYLNYASRHWRRKGENLPVGLILCSEQDEALAQYALKGMGRRILTREYRLALPPEAALVEQLQHARLRLEAKAPR